MVDRLPQWTLSKLYGTWSWTKCGLAHDQILRKKHYAAAYQK